LEQGGFSVYEDNLLGFVRFLRIKVTSKSS